MKCLLSLLCTVFICIAQTDQVSAADWTRFRGPNGTGIVQATDPLPVTWSNSENLKWKAALPGPGSSSPIVVGDRVFVTCWTGYAAGEGSSNRMEDLKRVLLCFDRQTGKQLWSASIDAALPEEPYRGNFAEHGYASHTPVSDGERVYVFYGKSGVHAYDMNGKHLWQADVGSGLDERWHWGTASSPILYKNLVIVTALIESQTLYALDKETGKVVWKQEAKGFDSMWGTPAMVEVEGRTELVFLVPFEIWGMDPETGKMLWFCEALNTNSMCSSLVVDGSVVYAVESGPGGGGKIAVRAGGKGDVTKTHVLWSGRETSRIGTPVVYQDRLYWVSGSGVVNCLDAKTGDRVYQSRLGGGPANVTAGGFGGNRPPARPGGPGGPGGFGGGRGPGGQDYSSAVIADGKLYYVRRSGEMFVVKLGDTFEQLANNRFEGDGGDFSASPAISNGELFIRSSKNLYCIAAGK